MVAKGIEVEGMSSTILETPTYILAVVLLIFFFISLGFEHIVHYTKASLRRRGREGLAQSVDKVVMEITFVGLVSLILTLFQQYVPEICVPYNEGQVKWTILDNLGGCPCCLEHTHGVTTCAQIYHGCAFNTTNRHGFCGCELGWPESEVPDPPAEPGTEAAQCIPYDFNEIAFLVSEFGEGIKEMASYYNFPNASEFCREIVDSRERQVAESAILLEMGAGTAGSGGERRLLGDAYGLMTQTAAAAVGRVVGSGRALRSETGAEAVSTTANYFRNFDNNTHLIPEIGVFKCAGPFFAGKCEGLDSHPVISDEAMHQTHLLVFTTAAMHIVCSIIVVAVALLRMRQWRRWQREAMEEEGLPLESLITCVDLEAAAAGVVEKEATDGANGAAAATSHENGAAVASNGAAAVNGNGESNLEPQMSVQPSEAEQIEPPEGPTNGDAPSDVDNFSGALSGLNSLQSPPSSAGLAPDPREPSALKKAALSFRRRWLHRDSRLARHRSRWGEAAICIGQALLPNLVSRSEFKTIRAGYIASHGLPHDFDFVREVSLHLDFDLASLIGQSVIIYVIMISEWLFAGLASWVMGIYSAVSALVLFFINVGLVAAVRYACRGRRPHRVRAVKHWWQGAHWLCHPLAGIIFLIGKVYASAIFFAWQFGSHSCFFSGSASIWTWDPAGELPFWVAYISPVIILLWVASVTVPAWAVVMHTRPPVLKEGEEDVSVAGGGRILSNKHSGRVFETQLSGGGEGVTGPGSPTVGSPRGSRRFTTQGMLMAEIARLQAELMEMQKE